MARSSYEEKDLLKSAGFRWAPTERYWYTTDSHTAVKFLANADEIAKAKLMALQAEREAAKAASKATDAAIEIPCPSDLAYLPYQKAGVAFATARRATLLGDQMGLGKTIQALGVLAVTDQFPAVIVCPASLKLNWRREAVKWLPYPDVAVMVLEGKPNSSGFFGRPPGRLLLIVNYDILGAWLPVLDNLDTQTVIYDECHYVKNRKAQRSQHAVSLAKDRPRVLALSGTPIVNRPNELVNVLDLLGQLPEFGGAWKFLRRYTNATQTKWGWDFSGASNLPELQDRLRSTCMIRRLKEQVLTELPPKRRQVIELPANCASDVVLAESSAFAQTQERLSALRVAVELAKTADDQTAYDQAVQALRDGTMAAFAELSDLRHQTALAKIPYVIEHLKELLDADVKVVCFAHHKDVIGQIHEAFPDSVVLTGDTSLPDRQAAVDRFQSDPTCQLFIGSITAAGVGLTLTASAHVVFAELDWVPGNVSQCEDRTHRIGQTNSVLVQHLVLEGSLDATMAKRLIEKQAVIDAALDKEAALPSIPLLPLTGQAQAATESASRKAIEEDAKQLSPEQIGRIHVAIRALAGVCDGARAQDGHGFNTLDTRIGHELAGQSTLTAKQAALAVRILRRYPRQVKPERYT